VSKQHPNGDRAAGGPAEAAHALARSFPLLVAVVVAGTVAFLSAAAELAAGPPAASTSCARSTSTIVSSSLRLDTSKDWMITGSSASSQCRFSSAATSGSSSESPMESK
jgi:hypothetical protein